MVGGLFLYGCDYHRLLAYAIGIPSSRAETYETWKGMRPRGAAARPTGGAGGGHGTRVL